MKIPAHTTKYENKLSASHFMLIFNEHTTCGWTKHVMFSCSLNFKDMQIRSLINWIKCGLTSLIPNGVHTKYRKFAQIGTVDLNDQISDIRLGGWRILIWIAGCYGQPQFRYTSVHTGAAAVYNTPCYVTANCYDCLAMTISKRENIMTRQKF